MYSPHQQLTPAEQATRTAAYEQQRATEAAERLARCAATTTLARQVARALGADWSVTPRGDTWDLAHDLTNGATGETVTLGTGHQTGRLSLRGRMQPAEQDELQRTGNHYGADLGHITVAADRPAAAIAAEITRRLLPTYRAGRAALLARLEATHTTQELTAATVARLSAATGGDLRPAHNSRSDPRSSAVLYASRGTSHGLRSVEIDGERVTLNLHSLSADTAAAVLAVLYQQR